MKDILVVFLGGGFGSVLRYFFSRWFSPVLGLFPLSTFLSNLFACFIFGIITGLAFEKIELEETYKKLIITGFCGGLSTFSTFNSEIFFLVKSNNYLMALIYIVSSLIVCFSTFWATIEVCK